MSQSRYEVLDKIADGGLGSVFKAYDRNLRREVALKRVRAETQEEATKQAEQLFEEARTLSTLQHPHIVTIFDVGQDDEGAYIVMELLKGETLEDIIERGALNEGDFRALVTQSLEGMIAAHTTGLIHLDIKPQNFMVIWLPSGKFQIKILDFGLSKISHAPMVQETDAEGAIMGSIFFMAPEQFERSPVDVRTDVYSLGCVFYFALTQQYPFQGETAPEVMASHLYHSFIPLSQLRPDLPPFIHHWVEWLMHRQPEYRPTSIAEALESFTTSILPATALPEVKSPVVVEGVEQAPTPGHPAGPPKYVRPGSTTQQMLKPSAPRPGRPGSTTQLIGSRPVPKPLAKPVTVAAASAPKHLKATKPLPKWLTVGTPAVLAGLAVLFLAYRFIERNRREARFEALAGMEAPAGSFTDVQMLFAFLEDERNSDVAGTVLGKLQGVSSANTLIIGRIRNAKTPWAKKNLANAVGNLGLADAVPALLDELDRVKEPATRQAFWGALGKVATPDSLNNMIGKIQSDNADELRVAEAALIAVASKDADIARRSEPVLRAYRAKPASIDLSAALVRVLGKLGSPEALADVEAALKNPDTKIRTAGTIAFAEWPTAEPLEALLDFIRSEKDPYLRTNAINSLGNLALLSGDIPQNEIAQALITAHTNTRDNREQIAILNALGRVADPGAVKFFEDLKAAEPRRVHLAEAAIKSLNATLARVIPITAATTTLEAASAELTPGPLMINSGSVSNWFGKGDQVSWLVSVEQPAEYEIQISQSFTDSKPGKYLVTLGKAAFPKSVEKTSSPTDFETVTAGRAKLTKPGTYRLCIRPIVISPGESLMRLKEAVLLSVGG